MAAMTPHERMGALMMGEKPDRVPVVPFVLGYAAQITGISMGEFYADGDKCFEAQFSSMRLHGYEMTPMYGYACCGAWEFGGKVAFPYDPAYGAPYIVEHPVKTPADVERLEVPSFKHELPGAYREADKLARRCVEMGMPASVQVGSVFTTAASVVDTSTLLTWLYREKKTVHLLMEKVTQMFENALDYFASQYGAENCLPFDGGPVEANTVISPKSFAEFAFPYTEKVHQKMKDLGIPAILMHPCADQNLNLPYYIQLREKLDWSGKYFWLFGPETPLDVQIKSFGHHDIICGNVDPPSLHFKSYEEVFQLCKENIEAGINSPNGFVLAPGCEFPPLAPPIKLMAMMDAAEQCGRYE